MSHEVEITDLRDSAKAARDAAVDVEKVKPGEALSGAKSAIPGSTSRATIDHVVSDWGTEFTAWVKAARGYATTLETNATQYENDEAAAKAAFAPAPGGSGAQPKPVVRRPPGVHPKYGRLGPTPK